MSNVTPADGKAALARLNDVRDRTRMLSTDTFNDYIKTMELLEKAVRLRDKKAEADTVLLLTQLYKRQLELTGISLGLNDTLLNILNSLYDQGRIE